MCTADTRVLQRKRDETPYHATSKARTRGKNGNSKTIVVIRRLPKLELEVKGITLKTIVFFCVCINLLSMVCLWQTRKDATQVVANLQRQLVNSRLIASDYIESNKDLLDILAHRYHSLLASLVNHSKEC